MRNKKSTGEILKKYREDKKIKQNDLCKIFNVTSQMISDLERNVKTLSEDMFKKYCDYFDISNEDKEAISFYEDYRNTGVKTKHYIAELEDTVEKLRKENLADEKGRQIIEFLKNLALKDFLE